MLSSLCVCLPVACSALQKFKNLFLRAWMSVIFFVCWNEDVWELMHFLVNCCICQVFLDWCPSPCLSLPYSPSSLSTAFTYYESTKSFTQLWPRLFLFTVALIVSILAVWIVWLIASNKALFQLKENWIACNRV